MAGYRQALVRRRALRLGDRASPTSCGRSTAATPGNRSGCLTTCSRTIFFFSDPTHGYLVAGGPKESTVVLWTEDGARRGHVRRLARPSWGRASRTTGAALLRPEAGLRDLSGPIAPVEPPLASAPNSTERLDGGATWQPVALPRPSVAAAAAEPAALFLGMRPAPFGGRTAVIARGWLTSDGQGDVTAFYLTTDAGQRWSLVNATAGTGPVALLSPTHWLLGTSTGLHVTTDAGQTWQLLGAAGLPQPWRWFDFVDDLHGWAGTGVQRCDRVGACGWTAMYATTDGGRSWTSA